MYKSIVNILVRLFVFLTAMYSYLIHARPAVHLNQLLQHVVVPLQVDVQ